MFGKEKDKGGELKLGDLVQVIIDNQKIVSTHVEILQDNIIWVTDILPDIWNYQWRRQAFDVDFMRGEQCFSFLAEIEGRETISQVQYTRLVRLSRIQEIQRRASYRLQYAFDVYIKTIDGKGPNSEEEFVKCKGLDISETGLGLMSDHDWREGQHLECKFVVNYEEYVFLARVMRKFRRVKEDGWKPGDPYVYRVGVRFDSEDEAQLKNIRKFIFNEQVARKR